MEVSIVFEQVSPPGGWVVRRPGAGPDEDLPDEDLPDVLAVPFAGWLGLLAVLEGLLHRGGPITDPEP